MIGIVKWYNAVKGFGFLTPEDGSKDVFVHHTALKKAKMQDLSEGQRVVFDVTPTAKGNTATNLGSL